MSEAKYVSGPLGTHLRQGMIAAALGMVAIFLVDLVDMAFIAQLGEPRWRPQLDLRASCCSLPPPLGWPYRLRPALWFLRPWAAMMMLARRNHF